MSAQSRAVEASAEEYDLGETVPVEGITAVPSGTNVLVAGPAMLGTDRIALDVLEYGLQCGEHGVVVTPDDPANRVRSRLDAPADGPTVQFIDCSAVGGEVEDEQVRGVSAPGNLTDIGVCLTKATQAIGDEATAGVRISLLSLSTLLQYTDLDQVFKFVHVATGRFAAGGYLGVATIDAATHDEETMNTIRAQFDAVVELREGTDDAPEIRAVGFPGGSADWQPL